jgi:arylsulfatase A-like enzyme
MVSVKKYYTLFFLAVLGITTRCTEKASQPNILFIAIDDLRPELGCYDDSQVKSPNIDVLANEALTFNRAYCNIPVCGASRASMMTGILPTKTRFVGYTSRADEDVLNAPTLPQIFKEAGYTTLSNGKVFHNKEDCNERSWSETAWKSPLPNLISFDSTTSQKLSERGRGRIYESPDVDEYAYPDGKVAQKTMKDLARLKEEGKPFFLACGFIKPHMPFYAPKKYWDMYKRDEIVLAENRYEIKNAPSGLNTSEEFNSYHLGDYEPKTEDWHRMMRHGYFASTSYIDKLVGDVLTELENLGLAENTIVVIWGDHGWHLGEHEFWGKHNTLHNAMRIPLIIKIPGKTNGKKTNAIVQSIDLFPTLVSLAHLKVPESVQGKSFETLMDKPNQSFNEIIYGRYRKMDAIIGKDYSYSIFDNGEEMLFDRITDPEENQNVVGDENHAAVLAKMRIKLKEKVNKAEGYKLE